jgi:hypothetical protein
MDPKRQAAKKGKKNEGQVFFDLQPEFPNKKNGGCQNKSHRYLMSEKRQSCEETQHRDQGAPVFVGNEIGEVQKKGSKHEGQGKGSCIEKADSDKMADGKTVEKGYKKRKIEGKNLLEQQKLHTDKRQIKDQRRKLEEENGIPEQKKQEGKKMLGNRPQI